LVINPKNISPIFDLSMFRESKAAKTFVARALSDASIRSLFEERYLSRTAPDVDQLRKLPEGTFGRTFATFIDHYGLEVEYAPPVEDKRDDALTYLRKRGRQTHDLWHVALGYRPDELGEMTICAFYVRQLHSPLNSMLLAVGFIYGTIKKPHMLVALLDAIVRGFTDAGRAKALMGVKWESMWERPALELRDELGIHVEREPWEQEDADAVSRRQLLDLGMDEHFEPIARATPASVQIPAEAR